MIFTIHSVAHRPGVFLKPVAQASIDVEGFVDMMESAFPDNQNPTTAWYLACFGAYDNAIYFPAAEELGDEPDVLDETI